MAETQLIEHRLLDEHTFVLLDLAQVCDGAWHDLPGISLAPREVARNAEDLPRLVAVEQLTSAQREWLLESLFTPPKGAACPVAALLATNIGTGRLANHLCAHLIVQLPVRGKHLFRYYDPRVFRHLLWMASPLQLATLFGPITAWTWRDAQGQWHRAFPPVGIAPSSAFVAHGLDLARIGLLERCLQMLRHTLNGFVDDAGNDAARSTNALLDAATTHGLTDEADLRLYVAQAMRFHPNIHQHPGLMRRLRAIGEDDSYVGACADLDTDTLNRYVRELGDLRKEHAA